MSIQVFLGYSMIYRYSGNAIRLQFLGRMIFQIASNCRLFIVSYHYENEFIYKVWFLIRRNNLCASLKYAYLDSETICHLIMSYY